MQEALRAAIYARFSSERQRDASIDDQVAACNEYCARMGYEVMGVYADYALSGRSDDRPRFLAMIEDAKRGAMDVVVVWKIDRFARNMMDQFYYEHEMMRHNVTLESCRENISGGTVEADINKSILALSAQLRSHQIGVDTMRGMLGKAQQCQYIGIWRFGYAHDGDVITLDPLWAPVAAQIHHDYLNGTAINTIISRLIDQGVKTYAGNDPGYQFVRGILLNWAYAGRYMWGKKKDARGHLMKDELGNPIPLVDVRGGMPAIVSEEVKLACIERLKFGKHSKTEVDYVLSGKLICGETGMRMHGESGLSRLGVKYYYYVCKHEGKRYSVSKDKLEQSVVRGIREMLEDHELCRKLAQRHVAWLEEEQNNAPAIEAALAEVEAISRQRDNIVSAIADGAPFDLFRDKLDKLNADLADAQRTADKLQQSSPAACEADILEFFADLAAGALSDEKILSAFVGQVVYSEGQAVAVMNFDDKPSSPREIRCILWGNKKARTPSSDQGFVHCKPGSPGRIRTYNPPVNSRMLCR